MIKNTKHIISTLNKKILSAIACVVFINICAGVCSAERARQPAFEEDSFRPGIDPIAAIDVNTMRTKIDDVRIASGLPGFYWGNSVPRGTMVSVAHVNQMRDAISDVYNKAPARPLDMTPINSGSSFPELRTGNLVSRQRILEINFATSNATWCGDSRCNGPETFANCSSDCYVTCGNGTCEAMEHCGESHFCAADCGGCPVNGAYGNNWSACSDPCDGTQTNLCDSPAPANGGSLCPLPAPTRPCNVGVCPVDGGWGNYTICATNGSKTRACNNPAPTNGGQQCLKQDGSRGLTDTATCTDGNYDMCTDNAKAQLARLCVDAPPAITPTNICDGTWNARCPLYPCGIGHGINGPNDPITKPGMCVPDNRASEVTICFWGTYEKFIPGPGSATCNGVSGSYSSPEIWSTISNPSDTDLCALYFNVNGDGGCAFRNCHETRGVAMTGMCLSCPCPVDYGSTPINNAPPNPSWIPYYNNRS